MANASTPYQGVQPRVLAPDKLDERRSYPVVYLLPVEPRGQCEYGDALSEVSRLDLHHRHQAIFAKPSFSHWPWYADHPTNRNIRQESYFLDEVLPFVERRYPAKKERAGRLLLGFSKSGWGAFSLLLRHPELFEKAVAWDAPLTLDRPGRYGSAEIFGTEENFRRYQIVNLLRRRAALLDAEHRLALMGYANFREVHRRVHDLMDELKIPHEYRDGPPRQHIWGSGWLPEAVAILLAGRVVH